MYAGKGKIELQAQSDGTDIIARKGIQIISTEDRIEIISPKEIILTADGSQLKINSSGIFPVTGGKLEVKAGQHLFMSGANIVVPKISLPTIKTPFSNKINYNWNINSKDKKELFIINKKNNSLIKTYKNELDNKNNLSSLRFYTPEEADFTAMIFNSDYIQLKQNIPDSENIDELLEETLLYDEENDDVYTEEEFWLMSKLVTITAKFYDKSGKQIINLNVQSRYKDSLNANIQKNW